MMMISVKYGMVCLFAVSLGGAMLGGCVSAEPFEGDGATASGQEMAEIAAQEARSFESVRVDGILYPRAQFNQHFMHRDLHWIVTQETLDQGIPTGFSTEEKRDAAFGPHEVNVSSVADNSLVTYATLYQLASFAGLYHHVSGSDATLVNNDFNDRTSSVKTFSRPIRLWQNINFTGCSFTIDWGLWVWNLAGWPFPISCGGGTWDNRTSSVQVL